MRPTRALQILAITALLPIVTAASQQSKTWTGTVTAMNGAKSITVSDALHSKTFGISDNCTVLTANNKVGALSDLRPGEQVIISYQRANGTLVAENISEKVLRCTGSVRSIDAQERVATVVGRSVFGIAQTFRFASDCAVTLRNGEIGTLEEVKPGAKVTISYTLPNGTPVACGVEETD